MTMSIYQVAEEVATALNTFTAEGFAEAIGFDADNSGENIVAEEYNAKGDIVTRYKITLTIKEMSN